MLDCKKTTCRHYMNEAERVSGQQLPPPACASCCHFYPSRFEAFVEPQPRLSDGMTLSRGGPENDA